MRHKLLAIMVTMAIVALFACSASAADKGNAPVAHWRFDEGGGPTAYDEIGSNDGTLTVGATGSNDVVGEMWSTEGKIGGAAELDGDDAISISSVINAYPFTVSMWVTHNNSWDPGSGMDELLNMSIGGQRVSLGITDSWVANGEITLMYGGTSHWGAPKPSATGSSDWNHIVWVVYGSNNSSHKIYVNGVSQTMTDNGGAHGGTAGWKIGSNNVSAEYWPGNIDELKIYDYTRTPAQVMVDYNAGAATHAGAGTDPNEGNPPVLYLPFNENTGTTTYDRSGSGYDGTITGASYVAGKRGTALNFSATNDKVQTSDPILSGTGDFTITAWVNRSVNGTVDYIAGNYGSGAYVTGIEFYVLNSNKLCVFIDGSVVSTQLLNIDTWYHVAVTRTSGAIKLYVNGAQDGSGTLAGSISGGNLAIGNGPNYTTERFEGKIDEVKIYNYARTAAQITYDYNKGAPVAHYKFDEGTGSIVHNDYSTAGSGSAAPVAWWRMDESSWNGTAGEVVDSSGNGNNGVRAGSATTASSSKIGPYCGTFNGSTDYATVAHSSELIGFSGFTLECWFRHTNTTGYRSIVEKGYSSGYELLSDGGGTLCFEGKFGDTYYPHTLHSGATTSNDTWYYGAVTYDGTTLTMYINGAYSNSVAKTGALGTNTATLYIGSRNASGNFFPGQIDDVRIYDYARTAAEVYNDYKSTHGTMVGDTKFVDGKIGKALEFDGTGDYVKIADESSLDLTTEMTLSAWIKPSDVANYRQIVSKFGASGAYSYQIGQAPAGEMRSDISGNGTSYASVATSGLGMSTGNWYHVATTFNSGVYKIYVNGSEEASTTSSVTSLYPGTANLTIGVSAADVQYFYGLIDNVRIYSYARTAAQILEDYNAGAARLGAQAAGEADPWGGALPVGHWKLDENTGVLARDASENNNDGTLGGDGAGTDVPTWTHGKLGPALSFDGGNDYVGLPTAPRHGGQAMTVACWVNAVDNTGTERIVSHSAGSVGEFGFYRGSNTATFRYNGTTEKSINGTFTEGAWQHLVGVIDGSGGATFYINGTSVGTASGGGTSGTASTIHLGQRNPNANEWFEGKIDDVRIYNYAFTQAQVAWLYNKGKPVAHYRFNESSGTDAWDESGNNNGTITIGGTGSQTTIAQARTAGATGKFGRCLSLDGTDDYATTGYAGFPSGNNNRTISAWIKPSDVSTDNQTLLVYGTTATRQGFSFDLDQNALMVQTYAQAASAGSTTTLSTGTWYHAAVTYDGTTITYYVNGVASGTATFAESLSTTLANSRIGTGLDGWGGAAKFTGLIDDMRVYNYQRTAAQILEDYNAGAASRLSD